MGYHRAGFNITGVDIKNQPRYPFKFIQADAIEVLMEIGQEFDFIHASPPCQGYSTSIRSDGRWSHNVHKGFNEPRLIAATREAIQAVGKPYVIENVTGAKNELINPVLLCGAMFGMSIRNHKLFETSFPLPVPVHPKCINMTHPVAEAFRQRHGITDRRIYSVVGKGRQTGTYDVWRALMEIPWAERDYELSNALPPAFTQYIGEQYLERGQ